MGHKINTRRVQTAKERKILFIASWLWLIAMGLFAAWVTLFCGCCTGSTGDPIVSPNHEPAADVPSVPAQKEQHTPYVPWWVEEK